MDKYYKKLKRENKKLLKDAGKIVGAGKKRRKNQGCYIATCVYGDYNCPEVWTLRRFRDQVLEQTALGRTFISIYYTISPLVVTLLGKERIFRTLNKTILDVFVKHLRSEGFSDKPYVDQ